MAAGQGFKNFSTGDVLTSSDVNGYLMQGVWVFANAAARTSAVTSPQEGNVSFLKDTNALEIYDGSSWVAYGSGDITGVTAGTGISGGGTSGDVTITNSMATAIDAKGDLIGGTGADSFARLAVGANGTVLTADSAETTGLKWASLAATKNFSLLGTGNTTSGSTVTVTGISNRDILLVLLRGVSTNSTANAVISLQLNSDTGANYSSQQFILNIGSTYSSNNMTAESLTSATAYKLAAQSSNVSSTISGYAMIIGGATSGIKIINSSAGADASGGTNQNQISGGGFWSGSGTITSVSLTTSTGSFDSGSFTVYGSA